MAGRRVNRLLTKREKSFVTAFTYLNNWMCHKVLEKTGQQIEPLFYWWGCPLARFDKSREDRVYAHTNHVRGVVCVSEDLCKLRDSFVYGILAHEFGHELAFRFEGDHSEEGADQAALKYLDLPIHYGTPLNVQYLDTKDMRGIWDTLAKGDFSIPHQAPPPLLDSGFVTSLHKIIYNVVLGIMKGMGDDFFDLRWFCQRVIEESCNWIAGAFPELSLFHGGGQGDPEDFIFFAGIGVDGQIDFSPNRYDLDTRSYRKGDLRIDAVDRRVAELFLQTAPKRGQ